MEFFYLIMAWNIFWGYKEKVQCRGIEVVPPEIISIEREKRIIKIMNDK